MSAVVDLRGRHFLTLADFSREELTYLLDLAADAQARQVRSAASTGGSPASRSR